MQNYRRILKRKSLIGCSGKDNAVIKISTIHNTRPIYCNDGIKNCVYPKLLCNLETVIQVCENNIWQKLFLGLI